MFSTVKHHGIQVLLPAAALALLLPAGRAGAQARLQARQNSPCQQGGSAQPSSRTQLNALRSSLRNSMRQVNALQTAQLTAAQLQAVNQLQSALQDALQQLSGSQNGNSTPSQLQIVGQSQAGPALQLRDAPMPGRR